MAALKKHISTQVLTFSLVCFTSVNAFSAEETKATKQTKPIKKTDITQQTKADNKKPKLDLVKIKALIDKGESKEALNLMEPYADKNIGVMKFDYLYGMAAADSGQAVKAIFALERVTTQKPNFAGARLELARAFYANGETLKAKLEFEAVLALNPPKSTKKLIQGYLDKINGDQNYANKAWVANVAMAMGSDTNANSATSESSFLGFQLSPESKAIESTYNQIKVGGIYDLQIVKNHDLLFSANFDTRSNADAAFADTNNLGVGATMSHNLTSAQINYGITYNSIQVAGSDNNNTIALNASVRNNQPNGESNAIFLRYASVRYTPSLSIQDVNQFLAGISNTYNIGKDKQNQYTLSGVFGADTAVSSNSPYSKLTFGARAGANFILDKQLSINTGLGALISPYDEKFYTISRVDTSISYHLKANYKLNKSWLINGGFAGNINDSSVSLFKYDRNYFYIEGVWTY